MKNKTKAHQLTDVEIAEAYIMPKALTKKQQGEAKQQLTEARAKSRAKITEKDSFGLRLIQLRFQMEDYLKKD
jgi:hypothetical protein